jgi:hypothetical protein
MISRVASGATGALASPYPIRPVSVESLTITVLMVAL